MYTCLEQRVNWVNYPMSVFLSRCIGRFKHNHQVGIHFASETIQNTFNFKIDFWKTSM